MLISFGNILTDTPRINVSLNPIKLTLIMNHHSLVVISPWTIRLLGYLIKFFGYCSLQKSTCVCLFKKLKKFPTTHHRRNKLVFNLDLLPSCLSRRLDLNSFSHWKLPENLQLMFLIPPIFLIPHILWVQKVNSMRELYDAIFVLRRYSLNGGRKKYTHERGNHRRPTLCLAAWGG